MALDMLARDTVKEERLKYDMTHGDQSIVTTHT